MRRRAARRGSLAGLLALGLALAPLAACGGESGGDGADGGADSNGASAAGPGAAGGVGTVGAQGPAAAITAATLSRTVATIDVASVQDCTALAGALTPLFDGLGDLSAEEANQLDPVVIRQIGTYLETVENRRLALGCDEAAWITASCAAMAEADSALAERFLQTQCTAGPRVGAAPTGPTTTISGSSPATATAPAR